MSHKLAISGGPKVRTTPFPAWPIWDESDVEAVAAVVRSGKWGRLTGDRVRAFEEAFAAYQGARFCVAVSSGTAALRLALLAAGVEAGDEVVIPPYTFVATATSVLECNAVPVFADIDPATFCLDPAAFEAAITPRTRAVIPVHLGGQPADMAGIGAVAKRHGLTVIEDAAHAHGGSVGGRGLGTFGDMGCFSFQASKNLNCGEGGAVLTDSEPLAESCRALHHCGRRAGHARHEHADFGCNFRLSEFQGALLLSQLARLKDQTERRNANGIYLSGRLALIPGLAPTPHGEGLMHPYHLYAFRYDETVWGLPRARFLAALQAEGIPASPGYTVPLYRQKLFLDKAFGPYTGYRQRNPGLDYAAVHCPACERLSTAEGCWLTQSLLLGSRQDMDDIVRAVTKVFDHRAELQAVSAG